MLLGLQSMLGLEGNIFGSGVCWKTRLVLLYHRRPLARIGKKFKKQKKVAVGPACSTQKPESPQQITNSFSTIALCSKPGRP